MPVTDLMLQGVELLTLGMGIVFMFLTLLIFLMFGMSRLARGLEGQVQDTARAAIPAGGAESAGPTLGRETDDGEIAAVIAAAIHRYRASRTKIAR